jgi:hypothetical protein
MISAATILENGATDTHSGAQVSAGARQQLSTRVNLLKHKASYLPGCVRSRRHMPIIN